MKVMTKFEGSSIGIHCFEAYKVIVKRKIEKGGSTTSYIWCCPSSSGEYAYDSVTLSDGNYKKPDARIPSSSKWLIFDLMPSLAQNTLTLLVFVSPIKYLFMWI
jgi:hypothetical protein